MVHFFLSMVGFFNWLRRLHSLCTIRISEENKIEKWKSMNIKVQAFPHLYGDMGNGISSSIG